jgi:hypothetical protein
LPRSGWPVRAWSFAQKSRSSDGIFFKSVTDALVVELVDTQDLDIVL